MAKFLVTFNDTIADIDINGFAIMTDKEIEEFEDLAYSITWPFSYKMGDDELEFTSGDDLLTRIDYKEITNEEAKVLKKIFNSEYGVFIGIDYLENIVDEEDSLDDEDSEDDDEYDRPYYDNDDYDDDY
jgi:hypothetical protein